MPAIAAGFVFTHHDRPKSGAADFQAFLRALRAKPYRAGQPIWLLLDKASCHTSVSSLALAARLNITPLWPPRQCSELNAMDHLWRHLEDDLAANRQRVDIRLPAKIPSGEAEGAADCADLRR